MPKNLNLRRTHGNHDSLVFGVLLVALCADATVGTCTTHCPHECLQWSRFVASRSAFTAVFHFFFRVQCNNVPAIPCIVGLCWRGLDADIDLFWWQSHSVVRPRERGVLLLTQGVDSQKLAQCPINWVDSIDDWATDSTHLFVCYRVVECRGSPCLQ
jgi:hypothetical protein